MLKKFAVAAAAALVLAGCATGPRDAEVEAAPAAEITISNPYVKAVDPATAMNGMFMTGAFMDITNNTDADVTLVGGEADFATEVQVHEVVAGKMQLKEGGFVIKAGETRSLQPGGDHMMFVGMPKALAAGEEVTFTAVFLEGQTVEITAPVKVLNMGNESYSGGMTASPMASHMGAASESAMPSHMASEDK